MHFMRVLALIPVVTFVSKELNIWSQAQKGRVSIMVYDLIDTGYVEDGEPSNVDAGILAGRFSPASFLITHLCCKMSLAELATQCLRELDNYRQSMPCTDAYGLELLRRAIIQSDQEAWVWVQHCFGGMVRAWLRRHPQREVACRLESDENYVAQTFERFWQATTFNQQVEFSTLAAGVAVSTCEVPNGTILDELRSIRATKRIVTRTRRTRRAAR